MAQEMLVPAHGQFIMDLSCGSGLFTKRFLASEEYNLVIGADYSEAMLEQCLGFLENETRKYMMNVVLMRADAGRLPFLTSSLAAVHAGAAIHCWPQPLTAVNMSHYCSLSLMDKSIDLVVLSCNHAHVLKI
ncbi:hypothetical protein O6H91_07G092300 [Diphasiastrum complanatum]|uniref:Uncharacterized protein n=1 Tax=Diphasiastrum complanatum TaxID=34168 RepID=A0ACC2D809_DIPCM|nr:hypothetical protein O6H91_07G092300 [Diphasiastrum complanatum]